MRLLDHGLVLHDQHDRPPQRHRRQRLEARVEYQRLAHPDHLPHSVRRSAKWLHCAVPVIPRTTQFPSATREMTGEQRANERRTGKGERNRERKRERESGGTLRAPPP
ncbi:hypothetical protein [Streptomyces ochraceiscleroticus]|uniref:Transposase n=1 Tax=Streptomyces ochraceiscleroticus TaxID=47761 RepID=A0ABW1MKT2_9ACTN